jgi:hypothetical protein
MTLDGSPLLNLLLPGIDISGARYNGAYTLSGTTINGTATLTSAGGALVTEQDVPAGGTVPIIFSLRTGFDDGRYHQVMAGGKRVGVSFDKIGDIP